MGPQKERKDKKKDKIVYFESFKLSPDICVLIRCDGEMAELTTQSLLSVA